VAYPDDGWKYHPKHAEQFPDINKLCNVASCWIYIGILSGAHYILHISRIKVKLSCQQAVFVYRDEIRELTRKEQYVVGYFIEGKYENKVN
jgi:hypothetical protein